MSRLICVPRVPAPDSAYSAACAGARSEDPMLDRQFRPLAAASDQAASAEDGISKMTGYKH